MSEIKINLQKPHKISKKIKKRALDLRINEEEKREGRENFLDKGREILLL